MHNTNNIRKASIDTPGFLSVVCFFIVRERNGAQVHFPEALMKELGIKGFKLDVYSPGYDQRYRQGSPDGVGLEPHIVICLNGRNDDINVRVTQVTVDNYEPIQYQVLACNNVAAIPAGYVRL